MIKLFQPTQKQISDSNLHSFEVFLKKSRQKKFKDYFQLWSWSVKNPEQFWQSITEFFEVPLHLKKNAKIVQKGSNFWNTYFYSKCNVNYLSLIEKNNSQDLAIHFIGENNFEEKISYYELNLRVNALSSYYRSLNIKKGDVVVGYLPNISDTIIAFLAAAKIGAVWSSCSSDFGEKAVIDRFSQLKPKLMIIADHYFYNGKKFNYSKNLRQIRSKIGNPKILKTTFPSKNNHSDLHRIYRNKKYHLEEKTKLLDFNHPLYVLFSSGTTGLPKCNHFTATAYIGGFSISLIFLIAIMIFDISYKSLNSIMSISFLMSIVGLLDDRYNLNTGGKLSLQIIPISYLIVIENFALSQLGDYKYFELELGSLAIPFTLICVLFLINAFNYFDGMDGSLGFGTISVLIILYFLTYDQTFQLFLLIILLPLIIFLCFNFSLFNLPKLFLGDSGSLLFGFVISFILIHLAVKNVVHPMLLAWSVVIFVYEFLSINIIRLKNNQNLFKAGHDHLHHVFFKNTNSIFLTNLFISITNIILFLIGYYSFFIMGSLSSLILFISFFIIFLFLRNKYSKKKIKR